MLRTRPPALGDRGQQQLGGARVVGLRQVVRHVGGEAHRRLAGLSQPELEQVSGTAGHLDRLQPGLVPLEQLGAAGVDGDAGRAGVGDRHRDRVEADAQPDAEVVDQTLDRLGEPLPLHVRLRAVQQQELVADGVGQAVQLEAGGVVGLPVVLVENHQWPAGPVVVQLVDVERRDQLGTARLQQVLAGQACGVAGVDETGECDHEHRLVGLHAALSQVGRLVQVAGVEHGKGSFGGGTTEQQRAGPVPSSPTLPQLRSAQARFRRRVRARGPSPAACSAPRPSPGHRATARRTSGRAAGRRRCSPSSSGYR